MDLPAGLTSRALRRGDSRAVYEVMAAQERADLGTVEIEEADIVADWQRPSYDLGGSSLGVFAGDALVGYAELTGPDRYDAAVHPDHRGRGIGTALAGWVRALAAARGGRVVGMPVPEGSPGDRLLAALGYHVRWHSWVLELPPGAAVPVRDLPPGHALREAGPLDVHPAYVVQEDAFLEWSDRPREDFVDWQAQVTRRPGFEPWNLRVVTDPAGAVVAVAVVLLAGGDDDPDGEPEAYVDRLATRPDQRGRGLGQALLADAFAVARSHGARRCSLSTDSRTGALGLYERVGMVVTSTWVNRAVGLEPDSSAP